MNRNIGEPSSLASIALISAPILGSGSSPPPLALRSAIPLRKVSISSVSSIYPGSGNHIYIAVNIHWGEEGLRRLAVLYRECARYTSMNKLCLLHRFCFFFLSYNFKTFDLQN